ncbi:MAG TPA: nitrate reductase associated protein [Synechococcus sp. M44_DOE_062]|nr:nitrate reductase associated protein [Synechococcus sp. M44_DOE_062]
MALFQFEQDFADSLRCIPMSLRLKLDLCGIKLKLHQWAKFPLEERWKCVYWPSESPQDLQEFRSYLRQLVRSTCHEEVQEIPIDPQPEWQNPHQIPTAVHQKTQDLGIQLTLDFWRNLQDIQRFALLKLSRSHHENKNFLPALQEFGLKMARDGDNSYGQLS